MIAFDAIKSYMNMRPAERRVLFVHSHTKASNFCCSARQKAAKRQPRRYAVIGGSIILARWEEMDKNRLQIQKIHSRKQNVFYFWAFYRIVYDFSVPSLLHYVGGAQQAQLV